MRLICADHKILGEFSPLRFNNHFEEDLTQEEWDSVCNCQPIIDNKTCKYLNHKYSIPYLEIPNENRIKYLVRHNIIWELEDDM